MSTSTTAGTIRRIAPLYTAEELAAERRALAATLRIVGPDAPTLVQGWTARDLAAHVAAMEQLHGIPTFVGRTLVARFAVRLNDPFRATMALDRRRFRRHGWGWCVRRLERDGPALLARPSVVAVSIFETFVHHEDVRRANGVERPSPEPDLAPSIEWLRRYQRIDPRTAITGAPAEVLLFLAGRPAAGIAVDGELPVRLAV